MTEAIVELPRLGLREHLVGLDRLLEPFLGVRCLRDVRVQLAREPSERLLDLDLVGVAADAEDFVVVTFRGCHLSGKGSHGPGC